jgi:peptidoglycan/xylan/chitin deacetylase (PgdA/CDA1 family)
VNSVSASDPGRLSDTGLVGAAKHAVQGTLRALHLSLFRRPLPRRVALYFHEIDVATAAALNEIIPFFKRQGYSFVKAREYDDDANPERRMIFLSFDDNYLGWHEHLPLFAKHGVNVAFYCNSLPLDRASDDPVVADYYRRLGSPADRRPLRSAHLRDMAEAGHDIGCHSHSHFNLAALEAPVLEQELRLNRQMIQNATGMDAPDFSFPFGQPRHLPATVEQRVRSAGFARIAHATSGMLHAPAPRGTIHRSMWRTERNFNANLAELRVDGQWFVRRFGRSPLG